MKKEERTTISEDMGNAIFRGMLRAFEKIIDGNPAAEKVKDQLDALKSTATKNSELTVRQAEAVVARCDNYMAGEYGNTKRPEHFDQGKPSTK